MADKDDSRDTPAEYIFDIVKPSGHVEFCGFIDGFVGSANSLAGLFEWTCSACNASNHDAVVIEPNQSFLAEWSCNHCDEVTLVRFRARPTTDWIAQHALAITGKALCRLAEKEPPSESPSRPRGQSLRPSQRMFAWVTVPLLAVMIILGLMDLRRIRTSSAYPHGAPNRHSVLSYLWLRGHWISESSGDVLTFGYLDPAARYGTYTRAAREGRPAHVVRFEIIHEETTDGRLVLRESNESPPSATPQGDGKNAILYITRHSNSMIRMTTSRGKPVLTTYYRTSKPSAL